MSTQIRRVAQGPQTPPPRRDKAPESGCLAATFPAGTLAVASP